MKRSFHDDAANQAMLVNQSNQFSELELLSSGTLQQDSVPMSNAVNEGGDQDKHQSSKQKRKQKKQK